MKQYDYLLVGSGHYGAIFAYEAKAKRNRVLLVVKRPHIADNIYPEQVEGICVHIYRAHFFQTNKRTVKAHN